MSQGRTNNWVPKTKQHLRDAYPPALPDRSKPLPLNEVREWLLNPINRSRIEDHLDWYLRRYDGRLFEYFRNRSDARRFTPWDILAVESLSVVVPINAAKWLIEPDIYRDGLIDDAQKMLDGGTGELWSCDEALLVGNKKRLEESGSLFQLYECLRAHKIGPVTTSKLLASKFPVVVPIKDSRIVALLDLQPNENWWLSVRKLFTEGSVSLRDYLDQLVVPDGCGDLTTLRRLDIILWMEANARNIQIKTRK